MSQTIIDDQDLTHVKYTGTWVRGGTLHEYNDTVSSSTQVNDFFTVSFTGNSITVFGTFDITSGGVLTNYSIDSASPAQATSAAGPGDTYMQQFWQSPTLNEGDQSIQRLKQAKEPYGLTTSWSQTLPLFFYVVDTSDA
ncbi:hypothetical protein BYT27DRAFT_7216471 [Phlegmacium glaucopus]|nr:hypothetical protein BYT27DRAFT_7216471 [Phlegmacium glaucopus]